MQQLQSSTSKPCTYYDFSFSLIFHVLQMHWQMQQNRLYLLFTRAHTSHNFNCRVLKIYFRRTSCAHKYSAQVFIVVLGVAFKNCMENSSRQIEYMNSNDTDITWLTYLMLKCCNERRFNKYIYSHQNINEWRDFKITALDRNCVVQWKCDC